MCDKYMFVNTCDDGHTTCSCDITQSFLELTDQMVRDILNLKADTAKMLFVIKEYLAPVYAQDAMDTWGFSLKLRHTGYEGEAYMLYKDFYYDGGDPFAFKSYLDYLSNLSEGMEDDIHKTF